MGIALYQVILVQLVRSLLHGVGYAKTGHRLKRHDKGHDETVQTEGFGENEREDHSDEQAGLLGVGPDTGVTNDTDGISGGLRTDRS
ncbi:ribose-5-phosphate isomerase, putative [Babesia ovata]|uniref:Ribose-5-phosphate isomerase, putative n=1 Tax=Babesia ovata TaxID=189622 RepID=A0A2H6KF99_9APIC|nr:ribose-5-phosphate isomerase, putative [Babesia ovata]GBE61671.1 ribose-5-phosphate isomerase, putative [Babesia ovata]